MAEAPVISSRQNPRVQALARLRERAARRERGLFLVEGFREVSRAVAAGVALEEFYFCPELFKQSEAAQLAEQIRGTSVACWELGGSAFEKVSGRDGSDGILAVAHCWEARLDLLRLPENPLLLAVEAVEKPGNLGALFRTADSAGCSALLCCDPVTDVFNPSVVRSSQGALFSMPCAVATAEETAAFLRRKGIRVFATTPGAERDLWTADFSGPSAILLGSEKDGLSRFWLEDTECRQIGIPQAGLSDSLNVGMAGTICLYEAVRQRRRG